MYSTMSYKNNVNLCMVWVNGTCAHKPDTVYTVASAPSVAGQVYANIQYVFRKKYLTLTKKSMLS